jgi:hypothetical protein
VIIYFIRYIYIRKNSTSIRKPVDCPCIPIAIASRMFVIDRFCGLVVRVPGYISTGSGSIPGAKRFSGK